MKENIFMQSENQSSQNTPNGNNSKPCPPGYQVAVGAGGNPNDFGCAPAARIDAGLWILLGVAIAIIFKKFYKNS